MMRLLADENFNNHVFRALLLRKPGIEIIRVQDVGLSGKGDPEVMAWALAENRILLTHDVRTIPAIAFEWIDAGKPIPGILLAAQTAPIGQIVSDILLIVEASEQKEWIGQIHYLPL